MNDYFGHIECVNLDRRPDKWAECEAEFKKHGLIVERFSAIDGNPVGYEGELPDGAIGNLLSHMEIIKKAKANGHESVLIFEDDVEFPDNFNELFNEWVKEVPEDWDLFYLAGNHNYQEKILVAPHVRKIDDTYTTHAYAIRDSVYDLVLELSGDFHSEGDVIMAEVQKLCNAYCFTPNLVYQRAGISDVFNRHVDYTFLRNGESNPQ